MATLNRFFKWFSNTTKKRVSPIEWGRTSKKSGSTSVGGHADIFVRDNYNVAKFDYGFGPSSGTVPDTGPNGDDEDSADEEHNDEYGEDVDDECDGDDGDVEVDRHASFFRTFNQVLVNEQGIYVSA